MKYFSVKFTIETDKLTQEELEWKLNELCHQLENEKCWVTYQIKEEGN